TVFPAIRLNVREQAPLDVVQLVARQRDDRGVDRRLFAAGPEPDMWSELVRVAGVGAGPREPADVTVALDDRDVVPLLAEEVRHRSAGDSTTQDQNLVVHALTCCCSPSSTRRYAA